MNSDWNEEPYAPETCLACRKALSEEKMEAGIYVCDEGCEAIHQELLAKEAKEEQEYMEDICWQGDPGSYPLPQDPEPSDFESDLAFDAARERRFTR